MRATGRWVEDEVVNGMVTAGGHVVPPFKARGAPLTNHLELPLYILELYSKSIHGDWQETAPSPEPSIRMVWTQRSAKTLFERQLTRSTCLDTA